VALDYSGRRRDRVAAAKSAFLHLDQGR
jgi:hypothetical protein